MLSDICDSADCYSCDCLSFVQLTRWRWPPGCEKQVVVVVYCTAEMLQLLMFRAFLPRWSCC